MFRNLTYPLILALALFIGLSLKACSLGNYRYCENALGKKFEFGTKIFKNDTQNEVPNFKRKYKTKGIQVIIPAIPFLAIQEFSYHNDFVPHLTRSNKTHFQVRANCKRGPPLVQ